ncbi:MAG: hypothetical protein WCH74_11885, partial [Chloroflexota bacterium]
MAVSTVLRGSSRRISASCRSISAIAAGSSDAAGPADEDGPANGDAGADGVALGGRVGVDAGVIGAATAKQGWW